MNTKRLVVSGCFGVMLGCLTGPALAESTQQAHFAQSLPGWAALKSALTKSITASAGLNGGLGFNMWGTIVAADKPRKSQKTTVTSRR